MPVSRHPARASPSGPVARGRTIHSVRSGSPSGPFTTTWVAASNLSVGSGLVVIIFRWAHLTASARFRVRALGPVSGRLSIAISWRTDQVRWFPAAFRPPAFASRSSGSRRGVGPSSRSAYRTTGSDLDGVSAFRTHELRPGWAPSVPRGRRCSSRTGATTRPAPAASQRPVPPPANHPIDADFALRGINQGFTRVRPSSLPLACGHPDGTGRPWAFPRASHPADQEPNDARRGGNRPSSTDLELLAQHHISRSPIR